MPDLLKHSKRIYETLPLHKLTDKMFLREAGTYYTLINYPPIKGMDEYKGEEISFLKPTEKSKRLYIHIPFCSGKCTFCNYKIIVNTQHTMMYLEYLLREVDIIKEYYGDLSINNILFGGGTPSLLSLKELEYLYNNLSSKVNISKSSYLGFEIHPEMVHDPECEAKLQFLKDIGVGRINIGVQTFDDDVLEIIYRRHSAKDSRTIIDMCKKLDFDYINFDLILGLPRQSLSSWEDTIKTAISLEPTSISPFLCWLKESAPMYLHYQRNPEEFPSREEWLLMIIMYMEEFDRTGYQFGTIDYYFKPKVEIDQSIPLDIDHFLHTDFEVIPTGISGYGLINNTRYMNYTEINDYFRAIDQGRLPVWRYYSLPEDDVIRLNLMYSLRYDNVNVQEFRKRYGIDILRHYGDIFKHLEAKDLLHIEGNRVSLTYTGKIFSDEVCTFFVSDRVKQKIRQNEKIENRNSYLLETYNYMYDVTKV